MHEGEIFEVIDSMYSTDFNLFVILSKFLFRLVTVVVIYLNSSHSFHCHFMPRIIKLLSRH
jgi:hypothetical protein